MERETEFGECEGAADPDLATDTLGPEKLQQQHEYEQVCQPLKVYLRVRPFSKSEVANNECQDCVTIEDSEMVTLQAPKQSFAMKNSEKGIGQSMHKFTFTQIFGEDTSQADFFEGTVKDLVNAFIDGKNGLVFTYGVTNAGKTFTIQGTPKDGGILPRSLDAIFSRIKGKHYLKMDFKPHLSNDVMKLDDAQAKQEEAMKTSILATLKEETDRVLRSTSQSSLRSLKSSGSLMSLSTDELVENSTTSNDSWTGLHQFSVWVAFCEIYNEYVYDLLDVFPSTRQQKRPVLKVCEDQAGNSYLKDLKWFNVTSTEEACKILKIGNKNRSLASTRMNQQSSRSHSIFAIRLLRLSDDDKPCVVGVSEMSLCDLAGSERSNKTESVGDRLKEAGNINNSLLILGKCIAALKQNQNPKMKHNYIPFRESKLTRLFQPFFCGKGKACMIVNINQCASTYDETLNVMKFSAVAKEVVQTIQPRDFDFLTPRLVGKDGKPIIDFDANLSIEDILSEEDFLDDEDELDITVMSQQDLLKKIQNLREKLVTERQNKFVIELQIRKEMGEAMFQQMVDLEETWSKRCEGLKETYEEQFEGRFEMYKKAIQNHAYHCALDEVKGSHVPMVELQDEQEKVKDREARIIELEMALKLHKQPEVESKLNVEESTTDLINKEMCNDMEAVKKQCDEKEEIIKSLRIRIQNMEDEANQVFLKQNDENQFLKQLLERKEEEIRGLNSWRERVLELETTVAELQELLDESRKIISSMNSQQPKPKKNLFSNLKETVTGSPKSSIDKTKDKSFDEASPSTSRKRPMLLRKLKE